MRTDQIKRIQDLQEKLVDAVLLEADPDFWPGKGIAPADLTRDQRGDRYWCKKNAAATLSVLTKTMSLTQYEYRPAGTPTNDGTDVDKEIERAEKAAAKMLEQAQARYGGMSGRA